MSSNARNQGSSKTRSFFNGVTTKGSAKTRVFVFLTLVILTAVFSANALTATASAANADTAATQTGFVASSFNSILSFFGFAEEAKPAATAEEAIPVSDDPNSSDNAKQTAKGGCDDAPEGLLACYQADKDARDAKGVHNGEWVGAAGYTSGRVGEGAFNFNGKSRVAVRNAEELNPTNITVDGWVNLSDVDGKFSLVSKGDAYSLTVRGGQVVFASRNMQGDSETLEAPGKIAAGEWVHIAATHDGFNRRIYVDGVEVASGTQNGFYSPNEGDLLLGSTETREELYSGQADEVKLFGRALSAEEVKSLFDKGLSTARPEAAITFTQGAGQSVTEGDSGQANLSINFTRGAGGGAGSMQVTVAPLAGLSTQGASSNCGVGDDQVVQPNPVTINWVANQTVASFGVGICGDAVPEGTETFTVTINTVPAGDSGAASTHVVTILDQDNTVTLTRTPATTVENSGTPISWTLTRSPAGANNFPLSVNFTVGGTASNPGANDDYDGFFGTCTVPGVTPDVGGTGGMTIPIGATSCTFTTVPDADTRVEPDETIIYTLSAGTVSGYVISGTNNTQTATIINDDFSDVDFIDDTLGSELEGNPGATNTINYVFDRDQTAGSQLTALTVNYTITGVGNCNNDYAVTTGGTGAVTFVCGGGGTGTGTITFPGTDEQVTLTVTTTADIVVEADESVIATIVAGANTNNSNTYTPDTPNPAFASINDDDEDISVTVAPAAISEAGPGALSYEFVRNFNSANYAPDGDLGLPTPIADNLSVGFSLAGTATCNSTADYTVTDGGGASTVTYNTGTCIGTISFVGGDNDHTVIVTPTNDNVPENNETVIATILPNALGAANNYGVGSPNAAPAGSDSATATITNEDFQVFVTVDAPSRLEGTDPPAGDDGGTFTFTFTRVGETASNIQADFNISGTNPATPGTDFTTAFGGTGTFNNGTALGRITILGGAGLPFLGVQANQSTFVVTPTDDNIVEPDEEVQVIVTAPLVGNPEPGVGPYTPVNPVAATGSILNDDHVVTVVVNPTSVTEDSAQNLVYTFTRTGGNAAALTVQFDITGSAGLDGTDFTSAPALTLGNDRTIVIPAGQSSVDWVVNPTNDLLEEADETLTATLDSGITGYTVGVPGAASGTIVNDDFGVSVAITGSPANEGNTGAGTTSAPSNLTATFTRTGDISLGLTVNFTVAGTSANPVAANDITGVAFGGPINQASFAPGSATSAPIIITPVADNTVEADEELTVTVQPGLGYVVTPGAGSSAAGLVRNDDNTMSCAISGNVNEGTSAAPTSTAAGVITVTCTRTTNGDQVNQNLDVAFTTSTGDYTVSDTTPLTFVANGNQVQTASFTFNADPDSDVEADEQVTATFVNGLDPAVGANQDGYYFPNGGQTLNSTFYNDDNNVTVSVVTVNAANDTVLDNVAPIDVYESSTNLLRYRFARSTQGQAGLAALPVNFNVNGTIVGVAACANAPCADTFAVDFALNNAVTWNPATGLGTVSIPAGNSSTVDIFVDPSSDTDVEPTNTVNVGINAGLNYTGGAAALGNILNDDTSFSVAPVGGSANEGNVNGQFLLDGVNANPHFSDNNLTPHGSHAQFTVTRAGDMSIEQRIDISTIVDGALGAGTANAGPNGSSCGGSDAQGIIDYITDGKTLVFAANDASTKSFFVAVCGDLAFENNETINVQLTNPAPLPVAPFSVTIPVGTAQWEIVNDDPKAGQGFWLRPTNVTVTEGGVATFQVCLYANESTPASPNPDSLNAGGPDRAAIFFDYRFVDGTATRGGPNPDDFTATDSDNMVDDASIAQGAACSGDIVVQTNDDNLFDGDEYYFIDVYNVNAGQNNVNPIIPPLGRNTFPAGGSVTASPAANNAPGRGRGIILDNEGQNTYTISDVNQAEGNGGDNATTFNHLLTQNGSAAGNQTVCWVTFDGNLAVPGGGPNPAIGGPTASGLNDYTSINTPNCYTFVPGGPVTVNVPVVINGDNYFEPDNTYTVKLVSLNGNPGGPAFPPNSSHPGNPNYAGLGIGTIQNDDATPVVGILNRPNALETDAAGNAGEFGIPVTFTLTGPSASVTSLTYTVSTPGLPASSTGVNLGPVYPTSPATGFVACTGTIDMYPPSSGNSSPSPGTGSGSPVSVNTLIAGLPAANVNTTINLVGCGDLRPEFNETFTVTITSATNAIVAPITAGNSPCPTTNGSSCGAKSGFITDNDVIGPINFTDPNGLTNGDIALAEGSTVGGLTDFDFLVRYQGVPADYPISMTLESVDGTAQDDNPSSEDNDYIARNNVSGNPCVVTFPAGSNTAQPCKIQGRHDSVQEINETFTVQITSVTTTAANVVGNNIFGVAVPFDSTYNTPGNPAPPGTDLVAQGTIMNDDGDRVFSVTAVTQTEGTVSPYNGTSTKQFVHRIEAQGASNQISTVNYTVQGRTSSTSVLQARTGSDCSTADSSSTGTDVISQSGTATFQPTGSGTGAGFDFVDVAVLVCMDTRQELDEQYQVALTAVTNSSISTGSGNGVGTIVNDDGPVYSLVTSTININEGNNPGNGNTSNATITVVKTGANNAASTLTYSTTNGTGVGAVDCSNTPVDGNPDYRSATNAAATGFAAGETGSRLIQIPVCGDTFGEVNDTFTVTITPSDGAPLTAIVNIINDDGPVLGNAGVEGDVVGNLGETAGGGGIQANDVTVISQAVLGQYTIVTNPNQFQRADSNGNCGNGAIDPGDVTVISQWALGQNLPSPNACGFTVPTATGAEEASRPDTVGRIIRAVSTNGVAGQTVTVPIILESQGNEASISYTITFPQATLSNPVVALGTGVPSGTTFGLNTSQVAQGRLGVLVATGNAYAAGTRQMITVTFNIAPGATPGSYPVAFTNTPVNQSVSAAVGGTIFTDVTYEPGNVVLVTTAAGVRVSGRVTTPNGQGLRNATVVMTDSEGNRRTAVTSSFGIYTFEDVEAGNSFVMSVTARRYRFGSRVVNVSDNLADVDFVGQE